MTDEQRERLIEAWRVVLELDTRESYRTYAAYAMSSLIKQRSPAQVQKMEVERGLRA